MKDFVMTQVDNSQTQSNHILRNTFVSASVGAVGLGGSMLGIQKYFMSHEKEADEFIKSQKSDDKANKAINEAFEEAIKSKKLNYKLAGQAAVGGAVITAGAYLLFKGIKSLFVKKSEG